MNSVMAVMPIWAFYDLALLMGRKQMIRLLSYLPRTESRVDVG